MISSLLLDTNVWLDVYLPSRAGHSDAERLLSYASIHGVDLLYALHSVTDVAYVVEREMKRELRRAGYALDERAHGVAMSLVEDTLSGMQTVATAVGADASDLWLARKLYRQHHDIEDCLVVAAARRANADYLVTDDKVLAQRSLVSTLSPQDLLALVAG